MKKMSKLIAIILTLVLIVSTFAACGKKAEDATKDAPATTEDTKATDVPAATEAAAGEEKVDHIYFLNFKPECEKIYASIAEDYKAETGIEVKVVTAASNTYQQVLTTELAKNDPPTIFQTNGPVGYELYKDYSADLKDTKLYSLASDKSLCITSGDGVYGIPYAVEGYGIIYNNAIMNKYFALANKATEYTSMDQINNFAALKAVVEDMTANKDALGIVGVFASTSFAAGEDWRWQTHLANLPMFYEFKDNTAYDNSISAGLASATVEFKYAANFKNIFDLYVNNSCTERGLLSTKTVTDSMSEFALGQVAMVQNGNWGWGQISGTEGNVVVADDVKFMPIYTGVAGEETQGLCVGTENYFCINSKVSPAVQKASDDFLVWLFSSEKGKAYVKSADMGFIAPFTSISASEGPEDPLAKEVLAWMSKDGVSSVPWTFAAFPSQAFKDAYGAALLEYGQGTMEYDATVAVFKDMWASEYAATH